jgi:hypothetical protein
VVAHALGLAVNRVYIGEEGNTGGAEIETAQDHLPLEERIPAQVFPDLSRHLIGAFRPFSALRRPHLGHRRAAAA